MKILYVEDQLSENIPRISRLFSKYLPQTIIAQLKTLESDESGYGISPEEVKQIVDASGCIDIEYRFPDALKKLNDFSQHYVLYIIDRNLSETEYTLEEVQEIAPNYNGKYSGREGDYLLLKLILDHDINVSNSFFFLTAHSAQDEIRSASEIGHLIEFERFKEENFIEKSHSEQVEWLKESIINQNTLLSIQHKNGKYSNILKENIDYLPYYEKDSTADKFLSVLVEQHENQYLKQSFDALKEVYERMFWECSKRLPDMPKDNTRQTLRELKQINWLISQKFLEKSRQNFFETINKTLYGNPERSSTELSPELADALLYAFKDMICWFGRICKRFPMEP